jgi:hypothetical protein
MSVTNVLCVSIVSQNRPVSALLGELENFLDEESRKIFEKLILTGVIKRSAHAIKQVEEVPISEDIKFVEIGELLRKEGLVPVSVASCIDFLHALRGKENEEIRRAFFQRGGVTLLSTESFLVDGEVHYLIIAQDHSSPKEEDQRLFSVRLLPALKMFPCKLYRVIAARV